MKAEVTSTCQTCGARVPAGLDFCPVCALVGAGDQNSARADALNSTSDSELNSEKTEAASTVRRFENYEVMLGQEGKPIELGRGAMGITYKAFDVDLHFPVTLKVISEKYVGDESARLRFLREARAAAKVRHPNVASVFHLGRSGGEYFYAMEFVEGETLESLIKRSGRLEVKLALEITSQVAAGLDAVQEQKLVHRDIKPSNIMVRLKDEGRVTAKIIDLGLAKGVSESGSQSGISTPGAFAGTPEFASPEQFGGVGVDIRSDLYSLGVTLWEMLIGQAPFRGAPSEVMYQHQHGPLPIDQLKRVPGPVVALLEVLLQIDPAERIQSPADICNAIQLVTAAVEAGRSVSPEELKATSRVQLAGFQKTGKFAKRFRRRQGYVGQVKALFTTPRVRYPAWLLLALLIAGAVILTLNAFFGVRHPATESSITPSAALTVLEKSIAVLPFESLSDNKGDTYFADGVQDEILSKLARLSQLKVISRTSVMAYRPPNNQNVRSIGTSLGVAHLVEGTVQRDGGRVRITTELIDARTDETLWSESYQRDLTDIFAIQSEIAEAVALKLSTRLSPEEQKNIGQRPTTNLEAYDLYLQGKELVANWRFVYQPENLSKGITLLDEATGKDPKFTLAYCVLARAHDDLYHYWIDKTPERRALADAAVNEALRLEPESPEAHLAMAYHLYESYRNYERASVQVELAQKVFPNSPEALSLAGRIYRRLGRWDDSTKALEKAYSLDPRNPDTMYNLVFSYEAQRRYREAEQINHRLDEIKPDTGDSKIRKATADCLRTGDPTTLRAAMDQLPPSIKDHGPIASKRFFLALYARDWPAAKQILDADPGEDLIVGDQVQVRIPRGCGEISLAALQGKHPTMENEFAAARDQLAQRVEAHPDDVELLGVLGEMDALLGRKQEAIEEATRAVELRPISQDAMEGPWILAELATVYAWTNEPDQAFRELAILAKTPASPVKSRACFELDPFWDPIRNDPRFEQLAEQILAYP
ncbi:MAG: protein kinase [Verrucomicrobia bacterium]|nr:protein kinase [Verrucomicrobiota bacterium]